MATLQCYAHGRRDHWQAICVDLDIAVHGRSFVEVERLLREAIGTYVEDAMGEAPHDRDRLLSRAAPLPVRLRYALPFFIHALRGRRSGNEGQAFSIPCHA